MKWYDEYILSSIFLYHTIFDKLFKRKKKY